MTLDLQVVGTRLRGRRKGQSRDAISKYIWEKGLYAGDTDSNDLKRRFGTEKPEEEAIKGSTYLYSSFYHYKLFYFSINIYVYDFAIDECLGL